MCKTIFSHSMSVTNTNGYLCSQGKTSSLATAKLAIFATYILWENGSKIDIEQLSVAFLSKILIAVAMEDFTFATNHANQFLDL